MNRREYAETISVLEVGLAKSISDAQHAVWFEVLKDLDPDVLKRAVLTFLSEGDDWPTPAKLRKLATEQVQGIPETGYDALPNVKRAMRKYHPDVDGSEADAAGMLTSAEYAAVQAVGGFQAFFECSSKDAGNLFARFRSAFDSIRGRHARLNNLPEAIRPRVSGEVSKRLGELAGKMRIE